MKRANIAIAATALLAACSSTAPTNPMKGQDMDYDIPKSLRLEHEELHRELASAMRAGGRTGAAAAEVADALHAHFEAEEEYALPPLGLLERLARGEVTADMAGVLKQTDALKANWRRMLDEHAAIVKVLDRLAEAARAEGRQDVLGFVGRLKQHAQSEEEVLYPAAVLVGEYVRLKLRK